jgi:antitoxin MazE
MRVSKWGNSLALRLPAEVVEILGLKEGDKVEVKVLAEREFGVNLDRRKERAIEALRNLGWNFPSDFKFDREEANER